MLQVDNSKCLHHLSVGTRQRPCGHSEEAGKKQAPGGGGGGFCNCLQMAWALPREEELDRLEMGVHWTVSTFSVLSLARPHPQPPSGQLSNGALSMPLLLSKLGYQLYIQSAYVSLILGYHSTISEAGNQP